MYTSLFHVTSSVSSTAASPAVGVSSTRVGRAASPMSLKCAGRGCGEIARTAAVE